MNRDAIIFITKEGCLSAIVSLNHVMRLARSYDSCDLSHTSIRENLTSLSIIKYGVPGTTRNYTELRSTSYVVWNSPSH